MALELPTKLVHPSRPLFVHKTHHILEPFIQVGIYTIVTHDLITLDAVDFMSAKSEPGDP